MPTELPISCSLSAAELRARLAEMNDLGRSALLGVERTQTTAVLRFRHGGEAGERLAAIVAAEARCCAFLDMTLSDTGDALALTISAPPDAAPVLDDLVAAFAVTRAS
jgi:hypothetical protein